MLQYIDHIGFCVNSIDDTIAFFKMIGKVKEIERVSYPAREQTSCIIEVGEEGDRFELMEPYGDGKDGVVASFLAKKGQGFHHVSLHTDDLDGTCAALEKNGIRIIGKTKGIAFTHPKTSGGILYEICDGTFSE